MTYAKPKNPRRLTKRDMLQQLEAEGVIPLASRMDALNTLDYTLQDGLKTRRIRLYDTDVVTLYADGSFRLNTGGWNTVTTRDRMNKWLPEGWAVFTRKGLLYLSAPDGKAYRFLDHVHVKADGTVCPDRDVDEPGPLEG